MIERLFDCLYRVGKDKYMHIVFGAVIASVLLCVFFWLPLWANILISVVCVSACALIKDLVIDDATDYKDILCTILGGALLWLPIIILWLWI